MNFGSVIPMTHQTTSLQTSDNQSMTGIENPTGSVAPTTPTLHSSTSTNTGTMGPFPAYLSDPLGLDSSAQGFFAMSSTLGSPQSSTGMIQGVTPLGWEAKRWMGLVPRQRDIEGAGHQLRAFKSHQMSTQPNLLSRATTKAGRRRTEITW